MSRPEPRYWNPYAGGVVLGLVLLGTFVLVGRGLGAFGAVVRVTGGQDGGGGGPANWLLIEVAGIIVGGGLSAALAGRWRRAVEHGAATRTRTRLLYAFGGGAVMAVGAMLARGCTSGQALSGGAVLSLGSWAFMIALFASAYAASRFTRRQWL